MSFTDRIQTLTCWQAIGRPVLAYCLASYVAGAILSVGFHRSGFKRGDGDLIDMALAPGLLFAPPIAAMALIPTLIAIVVMHETCIRRGLAEICVGAALGLVLASPFLLAEATVDSSGDFVVSMALSCGIAGAMAGFTYWLALGRPKNPRRHDHCGRRGPT